MILEIKDDLNFQNSDYLIFLNKILLLKCKIHLKSENNKFTSSYPSLID